MKKMMMMIGAFLALVSCNKEQEEVNTIKELRFDIQVTRSGDTKAVKQDFYAGDKVYVFFEDADNFTFATMTKQNDGTWTVLPELPASFNETALSSGKNMYAIYSSDKNWLPDFMSADDDYVLPFCWTRLGSYYETAVATYTLTDDGDVTTLSGTLNFTLDSDWVQFFIEKDGSDYFASNRYMLAIQGVSPSTIVGFNGSSFIEYPLAPGQLMYGNVYNVSDKGDGSDGQGIVFYGKVDASWSNPSNKHRLLFFDRNGVAKTKLLEGKTLEGGEAIKFTSSFMSSLKTALEAPDPAQVIDLGDGSGVKWAPYNLGATTLCGGTEIYRDRGWGFYWGGIVPDVSDNAEWNFNMGNDNEMLLYIDLGVKYYDGDTEGFDAAKMYWGADWRMPTWEEIKYLIFQGGDKEAANPAGEIDATTDCLKVTGPSGTIYLPKHRAGAEYTSYYTRDISLAVAGGDPEWLTIWGNGNPLSYDVQVPYAYELIRPVYVGD